jgi:hypothetical protein
MAKKNTKNYIFLITSILLGMLVAFFRLMELSGSLAIISFLVPIIVFTLAMSLSLSQFKIKSGRFISIVLVITLAFYVLMYSTLGILYITLFKQEIINDIVTKVLSPMIAFILAPMIILFYKFKER